MNHPNLLSIEGVAPQISKLSIVARWMVNGNVPQYLERYPEASRLGLVCLIHSQYCFAFIGLQIVGVARGLGYLHDNGMVHGDLEGVSEDGFVTLLISNGSSPSERFSLMGKAILVSIVFNTVRSTPGREVQLFCITARIVTMPLNMSEVREGSVRTSRMHIPCQCLLSRYGRLSRVTYQGPD